MQSSQQNATDQTANFFWLLVIIFIAAFSLWFYEKTIIVKVIFFFRHLEILLIQGVLLIANWFLGLIGVNPIQDPTLVLWQKAMASSDPSKVQFQALSSESRTVGHWLRWPVMVILTALAVYLVKFHRSSRFRRTFSMNLLRSVEAQNWPAISPVVNLNLVKEDIAKGPWAMAKQPVDFCREHNLLQVTEKQGKKVWAMDAQQAEKIFVMQMGALWQGLEALPVHLQALAVAFISKAYRREKVTDQLLDQIAASAQHGQLNFTGVSELVQSLKNDRVIKWLEERHAYVGTMMASLLEVGRTDGVLATAEFLWLRPLDRRMWYMLNTVGRRTPPVEVAGLYAHWLAEKKLQRPLRAPMIEQAVSGLQQAVNNILYVEEGASWRSGSED